MFTMLINDKSKLNPAMSISNNNWVISIVRDENAKNPEHAFLLLEGVEEKVVVMKKYDFCIKRDAKGETDLKLFETVPSAIITREIKGK